jgi:phosphoribosylformylglycinamidine synthase
MSIYRFVVRFNQSDPRSAGYLHDAHALGFNNLQRIICQDLFFIEGQLSQEECRRLALSLLIDPVTQSAEWVELPATEPTRNQSSVMVEVALRPGVTDPVSEQIVRAAHELGFDGVHRASTGLRFLVEGLDSAQIERLAKQLLANAVIQHWTMGEIAPSFPQEAASSGEVTLLPVRNLSDDELLALSKERRAARLERNEGYPGLFL